MGPITPTVPRGGRVRFAEYGRRNVRGPVEGMGVLRVLYRKETEGGSGGLLHKYSIFIFSKCYMSCVRI